MHMVSCDIEICRKLFIKKAEERANKQLTAIMTRTPAFMSHPFTVKHWN